MTLLGCHSGIGNWICEGGQIKSIGAAKSSGQCVFFNETISAVGNVSEFTLSICICLHFYFVISLEWIADVSKCTS